jgi:hypothetical protein
VQQLKSSIVELQQEKNATTLRLPAGKSHRGRRGDRGTIAPNKEVPSALADIAAASAESSDTSFEAPPRKKEYIKEGADGTGERHGEHGRGGTGSTVKGFFGGMQERAKQRDMEQELQQLRTDKARYETVFDCMDLLGFGNPAASRKRY